MIYNLFHLIKPYACDSAAAAAYANAADSAAADISSTAESGLSNAATASTSVSAVEIHTAETLSNLSGEDIDPGAIQQYLDALPDKITHWFFNVVIALIILFIFWKLINVLVKILRKSMEKARVDESMVHFFCKLVNVVLKIFLILIIAAQLGVNSASVIALLGSAGVAIGLAVQGTLSNLAGGIMILLIKPFRLGDYIIEDSKGHEGVVKEISLFTTKLITPDNRIIVLPNGDLANTSLTNSTGNKERLLIVEVGISYSADLAKAKEVLLEAMEHNQYVLKDRDMRVVVSSLADSSVQLQSRCWVKSVDYLTAKWELNESAKLTLDAAGVEIPFPQLDVHMK